MQFRIGVNLGASLPKITILRHRRERCRSPRATRSAWGHMRLSNRLRSGSQDRRDPVSGHRRARPEEYRGARRLKNTGPNGQDVATLEVDYYPGVTPKLGKWNFDIATYYVAYPGAFDPNGNFDYFELWSGVSRSLFDEKFEIKLQLLVARLFGETGNNDVLEFSYAWTFARLDTSRPSLLAIRPPMGHPQRGRIRLHILECGFEARLQPKSPARARDSLLGFFRCQGFTCPPSGVDAGNNLVVGSLKATF